MLDFKDALKSVLKNTKRLSSKKILLDNSLGTVLSENIYSQVEMPPFNKSAMDGYALRTDDAKRTPVLLKCVGSIQAGDTPRRRVGRGECVKIMTGAALPGEADGVIMIEDTFKIGDFVELRRSIKRWENICFKGEDIRRGEMALSKGRELAISDISLLAAIGRRSFKVIRKPKVEILNTGGEIVSLGCPLKKGSIYNSNGPQLMALLKEDGIDAHFSGIVKDKHASLKKAISKGLKCDMLLISGGVSMGDYDLVPDALTRLGVRKIFHKVRIKPGKPLFFGRRSDTIVFGIPGNPLANFLIYQLFIRPAIHKMMGRRARAPFMREGILTERFCHKTGRLHFVPAKVSERGGRYHVTPVKSHGSADIVALSLADAFMVAGENAKSLRRQAKIRFISWKE
ncbi:MAG: gephyrin-like molybdotransferase Glp [Candidatus Omnitrophota bacterium]